MHHIPKRKHAFQKSFKKKYENGVCLVKTETYKQKKDRPMVTKQPYSQKRVCPRVRQKYARAQKSMKIVSEGTERVWNEYDKH